ncbi:hypothetical protein sr17518 [Sporisorium reilianum SRZ2]|uniref:Uncharacterized protein n=1 Tax=Sporisorium reilianum (strain SRZ2) TaxID=999809 RepID=E6ZZ87_SPORE|nr:hypothetical protein sr17518 [Sporisorium reilianum SRZ2]
MQFLQHVGKRRLLIGCSLLQSKPVTGSAETVKPQPTEKRGLPVGASTMDSVRETANLSGASTTIPLWSSRGLDEPRLDHWFQVATKQNKNLELALALCMGGMGPTDIRSATPSSCTPYFCCEPRCAQSSSASELLRKTRSSLVFTETWLEPHADLFGAAKQESVLTDVDQDPY